LKESWRFVIVKNLSWQVIAMACDEVEKNPKSILGCKLSSFQI
jgi:hypothetical protein